MGIYCVGCLKVSRGDRSRASRCRQSYMGCQSAASQPTDFRDARRDTHHRQLGSGGLNLVAVILPGAMPFFFALSLQRHCCVALCWALWTGRCGAGNPRREVQAYTGLRGAASVGDVVGKGLMNFLGAVHVQGE